MKNKILVAAVGSLAALAFVAACSDDDSNGGSGLSLDGGGGLTLDATSSTTGDACADGDDTCQLRSSLSGILLQMPCGGTTRCTTDVASVTRTVGGTAGTTYDVQLHVSGVVELRRYNLSGPDAGAYAPPGSVPTLPAEGYSIDSITVSTPNQLAYLNAGPIVQNCSILDYTFTLRVTAGATVTLGSDPVDGAEAPNTGDDGGALLAPPYTASPYDGQFLQVDYVSSTKVSQ